MSYKPGTLALNSFSDADWAGDATDRKSTSGVCVYFGCNPIMWTSKKQSTVARSSTETEYRSLATTSAELCWLLMLLKELRIPLVSTPIIWCDNRSAISLASNSVFHARTKHIEIDFHFTREKVLQRILRVCHVPSADQVADVLTKPLSSARFSFLRSKSCIYPLHNLRGHIKASSS